MTDRWETAQTACVPAFSGVRITARTLCAFKLCDGCVIGGVLSQIR